MGDTQIKEELEKVLEKYKAMVDIEDNIEINVECEEKKEEIEKVINVVMEKSKEIDKTIKLFIEMYSIFHPPKLLEIHLQSGEFKKIVLHVREFWDEVGFWYYMADYLKEEEYKKLVEFIEKDEKEYYNLFEEPYREMMKFLYKHTGKEFDHYIDCSDTYDVIHLVITKNYNKLDLDVILKDAYDLYERFAKKGVDIFENKLYYQIKRLAKILLNK